VATILGSSLTFVDSTVVNVALPALQNGLHATLADVEWVIEAYALFLGGLILVGGSIGDQFGRKRIFLIGVSVFTGASMACGLAMSTRALILARAAQGAGAAFLVPGSLAIISATFGDDDRGRAIGVWSGFSALTSAVGPVAGGWIIEHVGWRAVFFMNVPLAAVVVVLSWRFMNESRDESRTRRIDWAGALLSIVGLGGIVFAMLEWPQAGGRPLVVAALACGSMSLLMLFVVERRVSDPMLPVWLFGSRTFTLANILTLLLYGALGTVMWIVPLTLIQVQHYSATAAGAAFLPFPILMFLLSRWSGGLVGRVGARVPLAVGPVVAASGMMLFARLHTDAGYWTTIFPAVALLGLGMAIVVAPLTTTAMGAVETRHAGVASGVNNAVARVAGLLAIAALGFVLVRAFDARAGAALASLRLSPAARTAVERELPKLAGARTDALPIATDRRAVQRAIEESFLSAFRIVMLATAGVSLAAAAAGAGIREKRI
jgi:EmrB/QacA subfamily drug resistance transporter